jgi:hypothetical protein
MLRQAIFELPTRTARELKVWAHQITPDGQSEPVPAIVEVSCAGYPTMQFDLQTAGEQVLVPLANGGCTVQINLPGEPSSSGATYQVHASSASGAR